MMKYWRHFAAGSTLLAFVVESGPVLAAPTTQTATLATLGTSRTLTLPEAADAALVISLGTAVDPTTGKAVEGIAIIHPKKGYHHRPGHSGGPGGGGGDTGSTCFNYLATGAKWKAIEPWIVNAANLDGLTEDFVFNNLIGDIAEWEDAADGTLGNGESVDILGDGSTTSAILVADTAAPDGNNEVYFADVDSSGAIAVTIVWGIFRGPPNGRELVEWDQVYDDVDFDWTEDATVPGAETRMDFENIAQHELGHSKGMGHPDDSCTDETMYRFATEGETKKRGLHSGDIAGIAGLY